MTVTPYMPVYRRADVTMTRGEGVYLYDDEGKQYLDFAAGIAVNALGHRHPHVGEALKAQANVLWHCSNNYKNQPLLDFSDRLVAQADDLDSVFFCSSGVEAVEAGIKFIRKYFSQIGQAHRKRIITFDGAFHGRSMAALSAGGESPARDGYAPFLEGFDRAIFNDIDSVKALISGNTAAILIEPIQGEGGIRPASKEFLQDLRRLCDAHDMLLFLDEVQCGYGRLGTLFAHDYFEVRPDLISCAKAMGNGFPLGACMTSEAIAKTLTPGCHGSTYGSNPLAMSVGNAVLDVLLEKGFLAQVAKHGEMMQQKLEQLHARYPQVIAEVRGIGLMLGLVLKVDAREAANRLRDYGLLVAPAFANVLRLLPPLIVEETHMDDACAMIEKLCEEMT